MAGSVATKAGLRAQALGRRDAMPEADRIANALVLAKRAATLLDFDPGTVISGFLPIRTEVDVQPLMAALAGRGARLCAPAIQEGALQFREFVRGAPLVPQGFGTRAPGADAVVLEPAIVLVPLAAFDRRLHRIGYGRGYYDRAIAALRARGAARTTLGLAFACQEVALVPDEPHDVALDIIATEREVLRRS